MNIETQAMLPIGTMLHDTYRIEEYLSSGGFGNTYVVTNVQFEERIRHREVRARLCRRAGREHTPSAVLPKGA